MGQKLWSLERQSSVSPIQRTNCPLTQTVVARSDARDNYSVELRCLGQLTRLLYLMCWREKRLDR